MVGDFFLNPQSQLPPLLRLLLRLTLTCALTVPALFVYSRSCTYSRSTNKGRCQSTRLEHCLHGARQAHDVDS